MRATPLRYTASRSMPVESTFVPALDELLTALVGLTSGNPDSAQAMAGLGRAADGLQRLLGADGAGLVLVPVGEPQGRGRWNGWSRGATLGARSGLPVRSSRTGEAGSGREVISGSFQ